MLCRKTASTGEFLFLGALAKGQSADQGNHQSVNDHGTGRLYEKFNFVKFKPSDFIDGVNFDELLIENIDL